MILVGGKKVQKTLRQPHSIAIGNWQLAIRKLDESGKGSAQPGANVNRLPR